MQIDNNINEINQKNESDETDKTDDINDLIKQFEEETDESINSNYFTENEKKKINNSKYISKIIHYIAISIGFYLMYACPKKTYTMLFFEIILNLFYPYIFIPIKLFLCRTQLKNICIKL